MADKPRWDPSTKQWKTGREGGAAGPNYASTADVAKKKTEEEDWAGFAKAQGLDPMSFSGLGGGAKRSKYRTQFDTWRSKKGGNLGTLLSGTP